MIGPYYSEGKRGAQPYPLELMIRIHFLQLVYNLSDPMCEETLHDSFACRRFVGLTMDSKCPDVNSRTLSCPRKSSYVPVCQLVKGIYLFK